MTKTFVGAFLLVALLPAAAHAQKPAASNANTYSAEMDAARQRAIEAAKTRQERDNAYQKALENVDPKLKGPVDPWQSMRSPGK